jgi:glycosyltransferase involved in cell wall biosynthesis
MKITAEHPSLLNQPARAARILSTDAFLASPGNLERTTVLPHPPNWVRKVPRGKDIVLACSLLRHRHNCDVVFAPGDLPGLAFAALQRLWPRRRAHIILVDCFWYREKSAWRRVLKKLQMQFCLKSVDACIVLAKREIRAYSKEFGIDQSKFIFIPHHTTLHPHRFHFTVSNGGYIFAGGNGDRDYHTFIEAVRPLDTPCVIACTDDRRLAGIDMPAHVQRVRATAEQFRQLIAGAMIVVVPMEGGHLHSGGQQSFLNAMALGKPVVVMDPEGGCDYIQQGVTGLLVTPGNMIELRQALQYLLEDERRRTDMGARALVIARDLSPQNTYNKICELADQLIQKG